MTGVKTNAKTNATYTVSVMAVDRFGNRATNYAGTVNLSTTGNATLPPSAIFTTKNKGRITFKVKFLSPGTGLSLTVMDQNNTSITGSETGITVL